MICKFTVVIASATHIFRMRNGGFIFINFTRKQLRYTLLKLIRIRKLLIFFISTVKSAGMPTVHDA